jgi:hypothetical protein
LANGFNPLDPTGILKTMRDAGMESWAKNMTQLVNTDAYARATAAMLDSWLSNSVPYRKLLESTMTQVLAALNMPSRADVVSLAERLTHIEMRLDDMEAKLDQLVRAGQKGAAHKSKAHNAEN